MGKYEPLYKFLLHRREKSLTLSFQEIELILGDKLPPSAYTAVSWWEGTSSHSVQAGAWGEASWWVAKVDLDLRNVRFRRP